MIKDRLSKIDWNSVREQLNRNGYVAIPSFLQDEEIEMLISNYDTSGLYRKTVVMERYRFGFGEYKYFNYPLPNVIAQIRKYCYPYLVPVANLWYKALKINIEFPATHKELLNSCKTSQQTKPTPLILKYGIGGYNTLHQDLYGDIYFPFQLVFVLNQSGKDFTGGEFVLTQQIPRAQSRAIVLNPNKGDMLIFSTNFKPEIGKKGHYRVIMKHGVSEIKTGNRYALGIIFHDAKT